METKNESTDEQNGKYQRSDIDNRVVSNVELNEATRSVIKDSDHNPQEISTTDSTIAKQSMVMSLMNELCSLKDTIIANSIKCIVHLLYFYIFDTIFSKFINSKERIKKIFANRRNEKNKREHISQNDQIKLPNVEKDSDSSKNQSSNVNNVTAINMPLNYENIDNGIPQTASEKPINISTERHSFNKKQLPINTSEDTKSLANEQQKRRGHLSRNKGNARNSRQKFILPDEIQCCFSFSKSFACCKYKKSKQTDSLYSGGNKKYFNNFSTRPCLKRNKTEQKKELFAPTTTTTNEKKKLTFNKKKSEKHVECRNKKEMQEKRRSSQYDQAKYKSRNSRLCVGNKESKRHNSNCKNVGTQTDSTFPTNYKAKMDPIGTMPREQRPYRYATSERDMNEELSCYSTDNEELLEAAYEQIASFSALSSSTNPNFDTQTFANIDTDIAANQWLANLCSDTNDFRTSTRVPPGFPEVPQNPPMLPNIYNPEYLTSPSSTNDHNRNYYINPLTVVIPPDSPSMICCPYCN